MKHFPQKKQNERGFALITAIMMLFAATIMGIMMMDSAQMEILLSGAQQRYEQSLTVAEGASNTEAIILDRDQTIRERRYVVTDPGKTSSVISPQTYTDDNFDPLGNLTADPGSPATDAEKTEVERWSDEPKKWPSDRILAADNTLAYRYLIAYENWDTIRKGYDSSNKGELCEYNFKVDVTNWNVATQSFNARIETGNNRIGPKPSLVMGE